MQTALNASVETLDEHERSFVDNIREHGWFDSQISADSEGPSFSYSTGFWVNTGQPEIITFAMKRETAHDVFWDLFRDAQTAQTLPIGCRTSDVFLNLPAYLFAVAPRFYPNYLGWSRWFYGGDEFPCLQLVWPDRAGLFPWEAGFTLELQGDQPDLTECGWIASLKN